MLSGLLIILSVVSGPHTAIRASQSACGDPCGGILLALVIIGAVHLLKKKK